MVLPEPYFSLSDSRDTSCAIRFFSEPVPQLRDSWDNTWCYRKPRRHLLHVHVGYFLTLSLSACKQSVSWRCLNTYTEHASRGLLERLLRTYIIFLFELWYDVIGTIQYIAEFVITRPFFVSACYRCYVLLAGLHLGGVLTFTNVARLCWNLTILCHLDSTFFNFFAW